MSIDLPFYLASCREENTIKKYQSYFKTWENWAKNFSVSSLPAKPSTIALFILSGIQSAWSLSKIEGIFFSINFFYLLCGYVNPCDNVLTIEMLEAAKRIIQNKKNKKELVTPINLKLLYKKLSQGKSLLIKLENISNLFTSLHWFYEIFGNIRFET